MARRKAPVFSWKYTCRLLLGKVTAAKDVLSSIPCCNTASVLIAEVADAAEAEAVVKVVAVLQSV